MPLLLELNFLFLGIKVLRFLLGNYCIVHGGTNFLGVKLANRQEMREHSLYPIWFRRRRTHR